MLLQRTEKARLELSPGVRTLSLRERSLLLLADGKPLRDLQAMYHGMGAQMVEQLVRHGYLSGPAHQPAHRPFATSANDAPVPQGQPESAPVPAAAAARSPTSPSSPPTGEALRSLAGARMYLFDTCERLFARRDPALAEHFRDALRTARDEASMLDVGEAMFDEVAMAAGAERAATLRERLDQLLPRTEQPSLRQRAAAAARHPRGQDPAGGVIATLPASLVA
ncbi:hypothetical protein [Acidovorax sp. RAC01]|uniref:hypothetical protein n=1 Tax=Acidovorax sp. RAC01 TaxID=1842533 RepID=UPI0008563088|nr:hypothetical protein BSY15_2671 [Acidovorax sp. RAC01]